MRFYLNHTPENPGFTIDHNQGIFLIGSCFSTHISSLLTDRRFRVFSNPNGILFNPLSISDCLQNNLKGHQPDEKFMLRRGDLFYSYLHHSSVHATSGEKLSAEIVDAGKKSFEFLKNCNYLIITFGTAFYYHHTTLNSTVANCHKQPAALFEKRLLSVDQILQHYLPLLDDLNRVNKDLKIIFTVSPVKHLKDGLVENNVSKSTLILAIHELVCRNPRCFYFPAYELVNDDLRDYRFYKEDMAHPNEQAINYIWEKFSACYFDPKTQGLNRALHDLHLAMNHRQMQDNTAETVKLNNFIERQKQEIRKLNPGIELG